MQLAEKLNVTDRAVSKWEQNDGNPDFGILSNLAEVLGVSLDYLIAGKSYQPKQAKSELLDDELSEQQELIKCKLCGEKIPKGVQYCPICGERVKEKV